MVSLRQQLFLILITVLLLSYCRENDPEDIVVDIVDPIIDTDTIDTDSLETDTLDTDSLTEEEDLFFQEMEVEHIYFDSSNVINIVFIGESFPERTLRKANSKYREAALLQYNHLFSYPPFSQFKADINFSIVYAAGTGREGAFNYGTRPTASLNYAKIEEYVRAATGEPGFSENTLILFGVSRPVTGKAGNKIAFFWVDQPDVMMHEVGHAFAFLADEYSFGEERPLSEIDEVGWPNVDITNDSSQVKWNRFFGLPGYEDIGIFEGGYYRDSGVWRPSEISVMRDHPENPMESYGYNAVCREVLVREIYRLKGDSLTFEEFLEIDAENI